MVRAAVETVAENSVDGVLSVLFFAALGYVAGGCVAAGFPAARCITAPLGGSSIYAA